MHNSKNEPNEKSTDEPQQQQQQKGKIKKKLEGEQGKAAAETKQKLSDG